ncbi:MAG TPA: hypothetical protein VFQ38_01115 [Longimicrobiales bacterium]|nr:hypothetical protein [Longimicrobiales bacterium]
MPALSRARVRRLLTSRRRDDVSPDAGAPRHRWPLLHLAANALGLSLRIVPRRHRFGAASLVARALRPLLARTTLYREQLRHRVDSLPEIALFRVLDALTRTGTRFDPVMTIDGGEALQAALQSGRGVLVVAPHAMLTTLIVRRLHDMGCAPEVVSADPGMRIDGTRLPARTIQPSPAFLLAVRSRLRAGGVVCAMIDRGEPSEGRTVEFATPGGPVLVADALVRLAVRCGARVVFTTFRLDERGRVVAALASPDAASSGSPEAILGDFAAFVRTHVARIAARVVR